jgi:hypothetical protein
MVLILIVKSESMLTSFTGQPLVGWTRLETNDQTEDRIQYDKQAIVDSQVIYVGLHYECHHSTKHRLTRLGTRADREDVLLAIKLKSMTWG